MHKDNYPRCVAHRDVEITQIPVLSLKHITENDSNLLSTAVCTLHYDDYGFVMRLRTEPDPVVKLSGISDDAMRLLQWVRSLGYTRVHLDADGCVIEGIPTFDW